MIYRVVVVSIFISVLFTGCKLSNVTNLGSDTNTSAEHYQGESCLGCHDINNGTSDVNFTSGGTVYSSLDATSSTAYAEDYYIQLVLENTNEVVNYTVGKGIGNSHTEHSVGTINNYTARVVDENGSIVNYSVTNSHGVADLDCNTCHGSVGTDGAPGRIVSYDYYESVNSDLNNTDANNTTPATVFFENDIYSQYIWFTCFTCHGAGAPGTVTSNFSVASTASATRDNLVSKNLVNITNVDSSILLLKISSVDHGDGIYYNTTSDAYLKIRTWISEGAQNN